MTLESARIKNTLTNSDGCNDPNPGTLYQLFAPFITGAILSGATIRNANKAMPIP